MSAGIKKIITRYDEIAIDIQHHFSECSNGFKVSPYLQDLMSATSNECVYKHFFHK